MKNLKLFFLGMALFTSMDVLSDEYNKFMGLCKIYYESGEYGNWGSGDALLKPDVKRAPQPIADELCRGSLFVSFDFTLNNVEIVVSYEGMELYKDSNLSTVCGDTFTYSLTEAGEYTTFVYVNGELVEEETILVDP